MKSLFKKGQILLLIFILAGCAAAFSACGEIGGTETGNPTGTASSDDSGGSDASEEGDTASSGDEEDDNATADSDNDVSVPLPSVRTLSEGDADTDKLDEEFSLFDDAEDFESYWTEMHDGNGEIPEVPEADFDSEFVFVAVYGTRSSGGYGIDVTGYEADATNGTFTFFVAKSEPGAFCFVTSAFTNPYQAVAIPAAAVPQGATVTVATEETTENCD